MDTENAVESPVGTQIVATVQSLSQMDQDCNPVYSSSRLVTHCLLSFKLPVGEELMEDEVAQSRSAEEFV